MSDNQIEKRTEPEGPPESPPAAPARRTTWRWVLAWFASLVVVFLLGYLPGWAKNRTLSAQQAKTERRLLSDQVQIFLANATIDARRGEYEAAREAAAGFFTLLNDEMMSSGGPALTPDQRQALQGLLKQRDALITLLARSDPASADRLASAYITLRKTME